ncbi:MAG: hypothetical protein QM765_25450 [Myxococcales bacterium]
MKRLATIATALVLACADDFQARSQLADLRVLAIEASPVEAVAAQPVTLKPTVFVPSGQTVTRLTWKFCPISLGAQAGYQCLSPQCEFPLAPALDGSVTAVPALLAYQCATALAESGGETPSGTPGELPDALETVFKVAIETDGGLRREAVQRVKLWAKTAPAATNRAPALASVELDGLPLSPGRPAARSISLDQKTSLRIQVDPASLDRYVDGNGQEHTEDPVVSLYTTAGSFSGDRTSGTDDAVEWTVESKGLAPGVSEAQLYFVVRDLRGGESVSGPYFVTLSR